MQVQCTHVHAAVHLRMLKHSGASSGAAHSVHLMLQVTLLLSGVTQRQRADVQVVHPLQGAHSRQQLSNEIQGAVKRHLELSEGVGVVSQTQRVEGATRVQLVQTLNSWALTVCTVGLSTAHEDDLQWQCSMSDITVSANYMRDREKLHW